MSIIRALIPETGQANEEPSPAQSILEILSQPLNISGFGLDVRTILPPFDEEAGPEPGFGQQDTFSIPGVNGDVVIFSFEDFSLLVASRLNELVPGLDANSTQLYEAWRTGPDAVNQNLKELFQT